MTEREPASRRPFVKVAVRPILVLIHGPTTPSPFLPVLGHARQPYGRSQVTDDNSTNYFVGYIGLRPLYDDGQYYTVEEHRDGTTTVHIHAPSGDVTERDERMPREPALAYIERLEGAGLPRRYRSQ